MNKNLSPGHNACAGCGQLSAVQAVMRSLDKDTILVSSTGCLEVTTTAHPQSAWNLPWFHSLFENAAPVASGIKAFLNKKKKKTKVVIQAGDGATYDIGLGLISGLWERGDDILYICYDTEAYSNTGLQASGATPLGANTSTTPVAKNSQGEKEGKKDMLALALAHKVQYIAQSAAGFPDDISRKVKKALTITGPSYIQILAPCVPGWQIKNDDTIKFGQLAVKSGLYPLLEYENGKLINSSAKMIKTELVKEYIGLQGRFKHLTENDIIKITKLAEKNKKRYRI
jgi:pyruvate ferredoxin oxidoreductase beta subunit